MATMISEVYDALKEAGASEEKARKAAEAIAAYEARFQRIETDLAVLKWMVGTNIAITLVGTSIVVGLLLNVAKIVGQ
jgi:hypothetical protein